MPDRRARNADRIPTLAKFLAFQRGGSKTVLALAVTVVTTAALCLLFPETRWMGVLGVAVMAYLHPLSLLVVASVVGVVAVIIFHRKRSSRHVQAEQDS